jgi:hypothetical protein
MSFHVIPDGFHPFHMKYVLGEIPPKLVFLFHAYSTWNGWNPYGIFTWNSHGIFHKYSMDSRWIPPGFLTGKYINVRNNSINH